MEKKKIGIENEFILNWNGRHSSYLSKYLFHELKNELKEERYKNLPSVNIPPYGRFYLDGAFMTYFYIPEINTVPVDIEKGFAEKLADIETYLRLYIFENLLKFDSHILNEIEVVGDNSHINIDHPKPLDRYPKSLDRFKYFEKLEKYFPIFVFFGKNKMSKKIPKTTIRSFSHKEGDRAHIYWEYIPQKEQRVASYILLPSILFKISKGETFPLEIDLNYYTKNFRFKELFENIKKNGRNATIITTKRKFITIKRKFKLQDILKEFYQFVHDYISEIANDREKEVVNAFINGDLIADIEIDKYPDFYKMRKEEIKTYIEKNKDVIDRVKNYFPKTI